MTGMIDSALLFALTGCALIGLGLYGFIVHAHLLRRILAFNVIGSGIFLLFGALGYLGIGQGTDPVPQALIITGIVVALSLTAFAVALVIKLAEEEKSAVVEEPANIRDGSE
jgi:multicomponent Na+:H+ antiporter subunit C